MTFAITERLRTSSANACPSTEVRPSVSTKNAVFPEGFSGTKPFWFLTSVTERSLISCATALLSIEFTTEWISSRSTSFFAASPTCALAVRIRMTLSSMRFCEMRPLLHRRRHRIDRRFAIGRHQQHIGAGFERPHRRFARRESLRDAAHLQRVGHDDAFESQFVAQNAGQNFRRKRGRNVRVVERRHRDMRGHDGIGAAFDRGAERRPLHLLEPRPVAGDGRQIQMRVGRGVAVSGEMLRGGQHARPRNRVRARR